MLAQYHTHFQGSGHLHASPLQWSSIQISSWLRRCMCTPRSKRFAYRHCHSPRTVISHHPKLQTNPSEVSSIWPVDNEFVVRCLHAVFIRPLNIEMLAVFILNDSKKDLNPVIYPGMYWRQNMSEHREVGQLSAAAFQIAKSDAKNVNVCDTVCTVSHLRSSAVRAPEMDSRAL